MDQTIFFKEHSTNDLFDYDSPEAATADEGAESPLEIAHPYKLKLLAVSNNYGYLAAAYNDTIKILNVAQFDRAEIDNCDCVATIDLSPDGEVVMEIGLNSDQTHLVVLTVICDENDEKSFLRVYDLQTLNFNVANGGQSPYLVSRIDLTPKNGGVVDMCVSPNEPNLVAILISDGLIQLWNTYEAKLTKSSRAHQAVCICWSPKGKQLAAYCQSNQLVLLSHELEIKSSFNCPPRDNLIAVDISWLTKKQFIITFVNQENNEPFTFFYDAITDKSTQREHVEVKEFNELSYSADSELAACVEVNQIGDWGLVLYSFSKCLEICHLQKQATNDQVSLAQVRNPSRKINQLESSR